MHELYYTPCMQEISGFQSRNLHFGENSPKELLSSPILIGPRGIKDHSKAGIYGSVTVNQSNAGTASKVL